MNPARAQGARSLANSHDNGVLCTQSVKKPGFPFGSVTPYSLDGRGRPIFLISSMAVHTKNLIADPHASLLIAEQPQEDDPLSAGRVNLMGKVSAIPDEEVDDTRRLYLEWHPGSAEWADFGDFRYYRLEITDIYYVGGFGEMGWVSASDYEHAADIEPVRR